MNHGAVLNDQQIQTFLEDGVLVVDGILSEGEVHAARQGLHQTLLEHGVDANRLEETAHHLAKLSSTNGSGGVLDLFYDRWKLQVATHPRLLAATQQLWRAAYCHEGQQRHELAESEHYRWHPYGAFDPSLAYSYIDRIGYRLPSSLAEQVGAQLAVHEGQSLSKKKRKHLAIQRSLTPHLDCCPSNFNSKSASKFRPIQCFVSLTNSLEPHTGGFEAARGFHRDFETWAKSRPPSVTKSQLDNGSTETISTPAPCLGDYTHIRPDQDRAVLERIQHIAVPAGAAVFWDVRIPHANAYRHVGDEPRAVVYCSFLPDVSLNRQYVANQLQDWKRGRRPNDQWIMADESETTPSIDLEWLSDDQRRLFGLDPWRERRVSAEAGRNAH